MKHVSPYTRILRAHVRNRKSSPYKLILGRIKSVYRRGGTQQHIALRYRILIIKSIRYNHFKTNNHENKK